MLEVEHIPLCLTGLMLLQGKFATMSMDVDEDEHSIEMHLPFIFKVRHHASGADICAYCFVLLRLCFILQVMNGRKFSAVPILVGNTKSKMDEEYGKYGLDKLNRPSCVISSFLTSALLCFSGSWRPIWRMTKTCS